MTQHPSFSSIRHLLSSSALFLLGGGLYYAIELLVRGWSHWTMAVCGGVCLVSIYHLNRRLSHRSLLLRALWGAGIITAVEFAAGCLLNLWLDLKIWSYAKYTLNILEQICPYMTFLWFLLSILACLLCTLLQKGLFENRLFFKPSGRTVGRHAVYQADEKVGR